MSTISTNVGQLYVDHPAHTVAVRARWADDWEVIEHLRCDWIEFTAAPEISRCGLSWWYGVILEQEETQYRDYDPQSLDGWYVRVEIDQPDNAEGEPQDPIRFFGIITTDARNRDGELGTNATGDVTQQSGNQQLSAFGLEVLLVRQIVDAAWVEDVGRIGRGISFNAGKGTLIESTGYKRAGNLAGSTDSEGLWQFANDPNGDFAGAWTARTIVEYLLQRHLPRNTAGDITVPFELDADSQLDAIEWHEPLVATHGRSVKSIIDEVIDRRRLTGYRVWVDPAGEGSGEQDTVKLSVFTLTHETLTIGEGFTARTIPANENLRHLDFEQAVDIAAATTVYRHQDQFEQVRCVGAPRVACFTISDADSTFTSDWSEEQATESDAGASAAEGYDELDNCHKAVRNAQARAADHLRRVYAHFRIPADWDGKAADGIGGTAYAVCPQLTDSEGEELDPLTAASEPFWLAGMRLDRQLPLKTDHDYSGTAIGDDTVTDNTPTGSQPEFLRPIVLALLEADGSEAERYQHVEMLSAAAHVNCPSPDQFGGLGRTWSCSVRSLEDVPGLEIRVQGAPQQVLDPDFTPLTDLEDYPQDGLDWHDFICTIAMQWDQPVEAKYPSDSVAAQADLVDEGDLPAELDAPRVLRLEVPDARLDYVCPGTVVAINDGELVHSTSGGYVQDDRERLEQIARFTYEWFSKPRRTFQLSYRQLLSVFTPGEMIESIGREDDPEYVYTTISSVRYDVPSCATSVQTDFAELDARGLFS